MKNKKIIISIVICLAIVLMPLCAEEETTEKKGILNITMGSSAFTSSIGLSKDLGRWEIGGGFMSGFPNLFFIGIADSPEDAGEILEESFKNVYGGNIYGRFDLIKSPKHDFDIGLEISALKLYLTEDFNTFWASMNLSARYAFNLTKHWGIYLESSIPFLLYANNLADSENNGGFTFVPPALSILYVSGLVYTRLGCVIKL